MRSTAWLSWGAGLLVLMSVGLAPLQAGAAAFTDNWDYRETRGLPAGPVASTSNLHELARLLGTFYAAITRQLTNKFQRLGRDPRSVSVRIVESYSHEYPVFLKGDRIYLPAADGVFAQQSPVITVDDVAPGLCGTDYVCDTFYNVQLPDGPAFDIYIIVGWTVELAGATHTNGGSIIIVADRFKGNDHQLITGPAVPERYAGGPQPENWFRGRDGLHAGDFILYSNILHDVRADVGGQDGEDGRTGTPAEGHVTHFGVSACTGVITKGPMQGGPGGNGGDDGSVRIRYTTLVGSGPARDGLSLSLGGGNFQCFSDKTLGCGNRLCTDNPSLAICDVQTEADNHECQDGRDNNDNGLVDCEDSSCSLNPYVTVCPAKQSFLPYVIEASAEACTDGMDNDGNGKTDCKDSDGCLRGICGKEMVPTLSGIEEASDAACSDGIDNDLDGLTDCADSECRKNPFISACGADEKSVETCFDGLDNDGDGFTDCKDFGCQRNPYVIICEAERYPFMSESTNASCSDRLDNDGDGFRDCRDFQCLNNPLVTVCRDHENSIAECTDGVDNDRDGFVDCKDQNCVASPFFGEFLCQRQIKTSRKLSPNAKFNGVNMDLKVWISRFRANSVGIAGFGGSSFGRVCEEDPQTHEDCCFGDEIPPGARGRPGRAGTDSRRWIERRVIDGLRSLLSPRQWLVDMAVANKHFKNGDIQKAIFGYTMNVMRVGGILTRMDIDCANDASSDDLGRRFIASAQCPMLDRNILKLSYASTGRNFFGFPIEGLPNPRERFDAQFDSFKTVYDIFAANVQKWLTLSNAVDLNQVLAQQAEELHRRASDSTAELAIAQNRSRAAQQALNALTAAVENREEEVQNLREGVQALDQRISARYQSQNGGLGKLILDVASTALSAYGGALLSKVGDAVFNEVKTTLVEGFKREGGLFGAGSSSSSSSGDSANVPPDASVKLLDGLFKIAGESAKDEGIKKAATDGGKKLFDMMSAAAPPPGYTPSLVLEEVAKELKIQRQAELALELADLMLQQRKARTEIETASMEEAMLRARVANLDSAARRMDDYRGMTNSGAELTSFDKVLLGHQTYMMAATLLDELTVRYWKLLRQAEYEFLPFGSATGENNIYSVVAARDKLDFNLASYEPMLLNLNLVKDRFGQNLGTTQPSFYKRFDQDTRPEAPALFSPALETDLARLRSIGFPVDVVESPQIFRFRITDEELAKDPFLSLQRQVRVRNLRVNLLSANDQAGNVRVFAVRDSRDSFRVSRRGSTDGFATFELLPRDLLPTGTATDGVHYKSFIACHATVPTCDLSDSACRTPFQEAGDVRTCSMLGSADDPKIGTFYDRSLAGEWTLVMTGADLSAISPVVSVEIAFSVAAKDF